MIELMELLGACDECEACLEVCPTYQATGDINFSPIGRIRAARVISGSGEVNAQAVDSIYSCHKCHLCSDVCPYQIDVPEVFAQSRVELVKRGLGPLERHNVVIEGMQKLGNAANGDPAKRLDWLPDKFPCRASTLLYEKRAVVGLGDHLR